MLRHLRHHLCMQRHRICCRRCLRRDHLCRRCLLLRTDLLIRNLRLQRSYLIGCRDRLSRGRGLT
jgi:hypothetical protein